MAGQVFRAFGYGESDAIAGAYTSSHKTIALGIPVLKTVPAWGLHRSVPGGLCSGGLELKDRSVTQ